MKLKEVRHKDFQFSAVYFIVNTINNKLYVGSSVNLYFRIRGHLSDAISKTKFKGIITRAIKKYGEESFEIYFYKYNITEKELRQKEKYWINLLKPEYNIEKDPVSKLSSLKTRKKISKSLKQAYKTGKIKYFIRNKDKVKPMKVFDKYWNFIGEFQSIAEMAKFMKWNLNTCWSKFCSRDCYYYEDYIVIPSNIINYKKYILNSLQKNNLKFAPVINIVDDIITVFTTPAIKKKVTKSPEFIYNVKYKKSNPHLRGCFTYLGLYNCPSKTL